MSRPTCTLVLGGARSGKSAYAEGLLADVDDVAYVATAPARPDDPEWQERIRLHRERRSGDWRTIEGADPADVLSFVDTPVLVDCLSLWLTGVLDAHGCWNGSGLPEARAEYDRLLSALWTTPNRSVLVSSEVGGGVVPETYSGRLFRDELGRLNAAVAAMADEVVLVIAGLPLRLKP